MTYRRRPKSPLLVFVDASAPEEGIARITAEFPEAALRHSSRLILPVPLARYAQNHGEGWNIDPDGFTLPRSTEFTLISKPASIRYDATTTGVICGRLKDVISGMCDHYSTELHAAVGADKLNYYATVYMDIKKV